MTTPADKNTDKKVTKATLIDITRCIGCHACQVACKQWNERDGEVTEVQDYLGFQNPVALSAKTYTLISFHELLDDSAPGGLQTANVMRRCLHCLEPACVSACPTTALSVREDGPVVYDSDPCIGCRYCVLACPWGVPTAEWDSLAPKIHKCTHCADRINQPIPLTRNGQILNEGEQERFQKSIVVPACVKACPADALIFGEREEMLQEGRKRISSRPEKYVEHIYGEHEAGGTGVLYLSAVPFEKLGFPNVGTKPYPAFSKLALKIVPLAVMAVGGILGATYAFLRRRSRAMATNEPSSPPAVEAHDAHVEFERLQRPLMTPFNFLLLALMALGAIAFVIRFIRGLGGSTNLSDTYPWGLWIVFDLVWIALAAGAFTIAGLIYIFQRKDLYRFGRAAVLLGFLSYSFVTVTLIADLGLPFHFYQLALNHPEHSAMFEVSWCVGLYVTILLFEFLPVPLERWGFHRTLAAWKRWSGAYVVFAVSLFVFMLSRNPWYTAATAAIFAALAWLFRARDTKFEPILLAIAAVTLSTMHQSSLGSLYLLMPNMLAAQWWSPLLPISFFVSSIAAGTAVVVLVAMWVAKGWRRPLPIAPLASMGKITFWSLLAYQVIRLADLAVRGQLAGAFAGPLGALFAAELVLGGILPLLLLGRASQRSNPKILFVGVLLTAVGVVFNRTNVVLLAMNFFGTMPYAAPETYSPSLVEWSVSVGLVAATIFLFGIGARLLPVLPKRAAV